MGKHSGAASAVQVTVRVTPKSSRNAVVIDGERRLKVALTAPPVDGKANAALVEVLAEALDVAKRDIALVRGHSSREKAVSIAGLDWAGVVQRLSVAPGR